LTDKRNPAAPEVSTEGARVLSDWPEVAHGWRTLGSGRYMTAATRNPRI